MATAKKAAPKRDYKAERERTKLNKQKAAGGTDAQAAPEQPRKATPKPKTAQIIDIGHCGHIDVPLSSIVSDPNQPRKFFDAAKLLELSRTIVEHGVLEPILIRPIPGDLYMVVFGERRFRASLMAGEAGHPVTTIPAMIKEMTDEQALEVQLIENLHRTDPHPIEDAFTFKRMLDNHTVDEIALRIGKSTKFVAMRMMLCDLIPAFQEVFFANKMSLGQAVLLCKVNAEAQAAIFSDEVPDSWKEDDDFMLDDIQRLVNRETKNLDSAPFNTEDAELYKEMGACSKCQFNSANTLQLFVEQQPFRTCGNNVCFNIKCVRSYKANIEQVMTDPSVVFVAGSHWEEETKQKVKDVQALGAVLLAPGTWRKVESKPKPEWEIFYKSKLDDEVFDEDGGEGVTKEFEDNARIEFSNECDEWQKEQDAIATARAEGKIHKAFIVAGHEEGKFVEVIATTPQAELALTAGENGGDASIAIQIAEINKREERNKELDGEKIWAQVREVMTGGGFTTFLHDGKLNPIEMAAFSQAVYESLGLEASEFEEEVLKLEDESGINVAHAMLSLSQKHFNILCRMLIKEKLFPSGGSYLTSNANYMGLKVAESYFPDQVKNIKSEQAIRAEQRAQRVAKKIEELNEPAQP